MADCGRCDRVPRSAGILTTVIGSVTGRRFGRWPGCARWDHRDGWATAELAWRYGSTRAGAGARSRGTRPATRTRGDPPGVVLGLAFFHAALVFDANDDFYVKNSETTEVTTWLAGLAVVWAMSALFLIAGLGSC